MEITNVSIWNVYPNPYQTRFAENEERAQQIALSIAQDGLKQPPTVRVMDKKYQLAFGHTRTRAWQICASIMSGNEDGYPAELIEAVKASGKDYETMPVFVEDITDEKMFRYAVTENAQRSDLSPIEEAYAMKRAMDDFGYTSEAAGALFGKNGSTVRGKIRLLELPIEVRDLVHKGEMPEGVARQLLTVAKVAPDKVGEAVEYLKENDEESPDFAIANYIGHLEHTYEMWNDNRDSKHPRGYYSERAWLINGKGFPNKYLPALDVETAADVLQLTEKADLALLAEYLQDRGSALSNGVDVPVHWVKPLEQLINPPLCSACDFYVKVSGDHICGLKACHDRKRAAWNTDLLNKLSAKHNIPVYTEADGKYFVLTWQHKDIVTKTDPDLRLIRRDEVKGYHYQNYLEGMEDIALLVAVGDLAKKLKEKKTESDTGEEIEETFEERKAELIEKGIDLLCWEAAGHLCAMFDALPNRVIEILWENDGGPAPEDVNTPAEGDANYHAHLRHTLAYNLFAAYTDRRYGNWETVMEAHDGLEKIFADLGMKLPKGLRKMAEKYDAAVAVETEQKPKKGGKK